MTGTHILVDDRCVSRHHANFIVEELDAESLKTPSTKQKIYLSDLSRFGTFVNGNRVAKEEPILLNDGDKIKLGSADVQVQVREHKLIFCFSQLSNSSQLGPIYSAIATIGGQITNKVTQCTHLIMEAVTLTPKAMIACIKGTPIVTPQYIFALKDRQSIQDPLPSVDDYFPRTELYSKEQLAYNPERHNVLKGKTFVVLTRTDYVRVSEIIQAAGGECIGPLASSGPNGKLVLNGDRETLLSREDLRRAYWVNTDIGKLDKDSQKLLRSLMEHAKTTSIPNIGAVIVEPNKLHEIFNEPIHEDLASSVGSGKQPTQMDCQPLAQIKQEEVKEVKQRKMSEKGIQMSIDNTSITSVGEMDHSTSTDEPRATRKRKREDYEAPNQSNDIQASNAPTNIPLNDEAAPHGKSGKVFRKQTFILPQKTYKVG